MQFLQRADLRVYAAMRGNYRSRRVPFLFRSDLRVFAVVHRIVRVLVVRRPNLILLTSVRRSERDGKLQRSVLRADDLFLLCRTERGVRTDVQPDDRERVSVSRTDCLLLMQRADRTVHPELPGSVRSGSLLSAAVQLVSVREPDVQGLCLGLHVYRMSEHVPEHHAEHVSDCQPKHVPEPVHEPAVSELNAGVPEHVSVAMCSSAVHAEPVYGPAVHPGSVPGDVPERRPVPVILHPLVLFRLILRRGDPRV